MLKVDPTATRISWRWTRTLRSKCSCDPAAKPPKCWLSSSSSLPSVTFQFTSSASSGNGRSCKPHPNPPPQITHSNNASQRYCFNHSSFGIRLCLIDPSWYATDCCLSCLAWCICLDAEIRRSCRKTSTRSQQLWSPIGSATSTAPSIRSFTTLWAVRTSLYLWLSFFPPPLLLPHA